MHNLALRCAIRTALLALSAITAQLQAAPVVIGGPITNPANGHRYSLLEQSSWTNAYYGAWQLGGHLVMIEDEAENAWILSQFGKFGGVNRHLWFGFSDRTTEGAFHWVNGQLTAFPNWAPGEPNHAGGENFVELLGADGLKSGGLAGQWNDLPDSPGYPVFGVVEFEELPATITGTIVHPISRHRYILLTASSWTAAEAKARQLGGDLVTINDEGENTWINKTFGAFDGVGRQLWIGFNDASQEGSFRWVSGETSTYTNWQAPNPNNAGANENYGQTYPDGTWNDLYDQGLGILGLVELPPLSIPPQRASATPQLANGFVVGITITDSGSGYTNSPKVNVVGGNGSGATATATVVNGVVTDVTIVNSGIGYSAVPSIVIDPPPYPPTQATGTASIVNGFVTHVTMADGGHGYGDTAPPVHFLGGGGTGATGVATVLNGVVTGITITFTGNGYTTPPKVLIAAPPGLPHLGIEVSQVRVILNPIVGYTYKIQISTDGSIWSDVGNPFLADESVMSQLFDVTNNSQLFRLVQAQ